MSGEPKIQLMQKHKYTPARQATNTIYANKQIQHARRAKNTINANTQIHTCQASHKYNKCKYINTHLPGEPKIHLQTQMQIHFHSFVELHIPEHWASSYVYHNNSDCLR